MTGRQPRYLMAGNGDQPGDAPPNRLIHCTSPYLRQHAHNPVEWYPWCDEAIERARGEDTPILLSIGYAACHWCHVMARECFEDPEIARLMNENFVCIKVDREERPDLDRLYMRAVQLLNGSGGWPLTVFLTPDLLPFYGGTYFPPADRQGTPGFPRVLKAVRKQYDERRAAVDSAADSVAEAIEASLALPGEPTAVSGEVLAEALRSVVSRFNLRSGGFSSGAQFPHAPLLDWLLRLWHAWADERPRLMLETTLDRMMAGGIFDQLGGGFHRYSVDNAWRVPHFEKMLYDNAQLTGLYADASRAFGRDDYRGIATRTADYVLGELRDEEGGFYSAQDADTPGGEGAYYLWTYRQVVDCLGTEEGPVVARHLGVTEQGNLEGGRNVLYRATPLDRLEGVSEAEARRIVERGLQRLADRRRERVRPETDRLILADWNGLMISGLAKLARTHPGAEETYLGAARRAGDFVWTDLRREERLHHSLSAGALGVPAFLSDHAMLAAGFLDLYESTFESRWLRRAWELGSRILGEFWDESEGVFTESRPGAEEPVARQFELTDEPVPSGAAVACHLFFRLAWMGHGECYLDAARRMVENGLGLLNGRATGLGHMLAAALRQVGEPRQLVIVGPERTAMRRLADEFYLPHLVLLGAGREELPGLAPDAELLRGKGGTNGGTTAYLCAGGVCREPVSRPEELRSQLRELVPEPRKEDP